MLRQNASTRCLQIFGVLPRKSNKTTFIHFDNSGEPEKPTFQSLEWNTRILQAVKSKNAKQARELFLEMQKKHVPYTMDSFAMLVNAYCANGETDEAIQVIFDLEKWAKGDVLPYKIYEPLIQAYCKVHRFAKALSVLSHMKMNRVVINAVIYLPLIQYCCANQKLGEALQLTEQVLKKDMSHKNLVINAMLEHFLHIGHGEYSMFMLRMMKQKRAVPQRRHFILVMLTLAKQGKLLEQLLVINV